jgi:hypothetical protein
VKRFGIVLLVALSLPAEAKPVYLSCSTSYKTDAPLQFFVTLDEETGKVTTRYTTGTAFNADGFFSANEVSFKRVSCQSPSCLTDQFTIDRNTLAVKRIFRIEALNPRLGIAPTDMVSTGQCTLEEVGDRKF